MRFISASLAVIAALYATGCMRAGLFALNAPGYDGQVISDVAYGPDKDQKLDIYLPLNANQSKHDVVVFFYGGRWKSGAKADYKFVGTTLAKAGYIAVIPDYKKYPQVRFPVFVQDGAKALSWVYDHIAHYNGDTHYIHVAGHSAGAHIASLLVTDEKYLKAEGKSRSNVIRSFVGLAGPYSFTPDEDDLKDMFGPPQNYPRMQATTFVDGSEPPMLLLYGDQDDSVKRYNLDRLQAAVAKKKGCVKTIIYPDIGHIDLVLTLSWYGKNKAPVLQDMMDSFKATHSGKCAK